MGRRPLFLVLASLLVALSCFLLFYFPPLWGEIPPLQGSWQKELEKARAYLTSHFNADVGLVFESEDNGSNVLEYYPELKGECFCWNSFWVYSDNLFVYHALKDHYEDIATTIKTTYDEYVSVHGQSECYEVLFGEDIPDQMHDSRPYLVDEVDSKYVFINKWNRSTLLGGGDVSKYADACVYKALDHLWAGDREEALKWFYKAYNMFDGAGVRDATAIDPNVKNRRYDTYKLALILYASRILEVNIEKSREIQKCLWGAQNESTGGIITRINVTTEKPEGSANAETTALALLVYEDELIQSLAEKARWADKLAILRSLTIVVIACAALAASYWFLLRKARWKSVLGAASRLGQVKCFGRPLEVAVLSAVNFSFALVFLAAFLAPFLLGVQVGSDPHGGAEAIAGAALATFFMLGLGAVGFLVCAGMSVGLWCGVSLARYFTMMVYGVALLGASLWLMGRGPQNLLAFVAISPLLALMWTAGLSGAQVDLSMEAFDFPGTPIILYRVAVVALAALTLYVLTRSSAKRHFSTEHAGTTLLPRAKTRR